MKKKILITTPIYYVNGKPHIGHVYSSLIADVFARMKRSLWYDVKFSTWVDENSQKTVQEAEKLWKYVYDYLDEISQEHKNVWDTYNISYTNFIRTSSQKHKKVVQKILEKTKENWYIYKAKYTGFYCVGCEAFKKEEDLILVDWKKVCPDHLKEPNHIEEENYFFKLKEFEWFLKDLYKNNPDFVVPNSRFNEVKSFVEQWVEDFSISREWKTFWIKFPFDENHTVYVWYDALFNYYTVTLDDELNELWYFDNTYHVIWKDIAKFHSIYRPAMLKAVDLPTPKKIFTTWFFVVDGQKMSKSLWNVIEPLNLLEKYGRDAISLYLFYDIKIGKDGDFSYSRFEDVYNNILIWWWGNLVYRISKLSQKFDVKQWKLHNDLLTDELKQNKLLKAIFENKIEDLLENIVNNVDYQTYLKDWYELVQATNKFVQDTEAWKVMKEDETKWKQILEQAVYLIHKINLLSSFFLLDAYEKVNNIFNFKNFDNSQNFEWFTQEINEQEVEIIVNPEIIYKKLEE